MTLCTYVVLAHKIIKCLPTKKVYKYFLALFSFVMKL